MILPLPFGIQRVSAQPAQACAGGFAPLGFKGSIRSVVASAPKIEAAACQYRYPSPRGRPFVPNPRSPAFSGSGLASCERRTQAVLPRQAWRSAAAGPAPSDRCGIDTDQGEPFFFSCVKFRRNVSIEGKNSCSRNPGSSPASFVLASRHVVTRWANRPWSAARPAWAQQLSPAATQAPARWSAQLATSLTARQTRAPAAKATPARRTGARPGARLISRTIRPSAAVSRGRGVFACAAPASGAAGTVQ